MKRSWLPTIFVFSGLLCVMAEVQAFGQSESGRFHGSIFGGPGWGFMNGQADFISSSSVGRTGPSIAGGVELKPFSHFGFEADINQMVRRVNEEFDLVAKRRIGNTFLAGNAVLYPFRGRNVPFVFAGFVRESRGSLPPITGIDVGLGAYIRVSERVSLRPEFRVYEMDLLGPGNDVLSLHIAYHW